MRVARGLLLVVASIAMSVGVASDAFACRPVGILPHNVGDDPSDTTPPAAPTISDVSVGRADEQGCNDGGTCDHGSVSMLVSSTDDSTPEDFIGYSGTVVEGEWPDDSAGMPVMRRPQRSGHLIFRWPDDDGSAFYVKLEVRAIDSAGNRSEPTVVEVSDGEFEGCGLSRARAGLWPLALVLLGLGVAAARRRRNANEL